VFEAELPALSDEQLRNLRREAELGELNFASVVEKLRVIRTIVAALAQQDEAELPSGVVSGASGQLAQLAGILDRMREFTLAQDQAQTQRNQIESEVEGIREWLASSVRPHLRGAEVDASAVQAQAQAALAEATDASSQIGEILGEVRKLSAEAAGTEMSGHYGAQADRHSNQALWSLVAVAVCLVALFVVGLYLFVWNPPPVESSRTGGAQWGEFVRGLIVRVFFLGLIGYALAFASRIYRASRHLQVVNEQKRNALNTYVLFTQAAPSPDVQNIITAEIARAVFSIPDTGFLRADQERTVIEQPALLAALRSPPSAPTA
jgi:hypothetical protein